MKKKFILFFLFLSILILWNYILYLFLSPLFYSNSIILPFSLNSLNITSTYPRLWKILKDTYFVFSFLSSFLLILPLYRSIACLPFFHVSPKTLYPLAKDTNSLYLFLGKNERNEFVVIPEKSLYQNILITGTIGSGKTSCCMYPFAKQLIQWKAQNAEEKLGMLILDVKGNFYHKVIEYATLSFRTSDLHIIDLTGTTKYNPLDKPNLNANVLANRLKTILMMFSPNSSEMYWVDKAEQTIKEAIKLCRLYNNQYVTFIELHKLITIPDYYLDKLDIIKDLFRQGELSKEDCYNALSSIEYFEKEFWSLDQRTLSILKSEISRITSPFVSDYCVRNTFCPAKEDINFFGFEDLIHSGKIVVLHMNVAEYRILSKIIATYLKLDFQTEVLSQLDRFVPPRSVVFLCDEFQEYISSSDSEFFAQSREAKCINIVATQSYSSFLNVLPNSHTVDVILQNLINKFWFRTDDIFTIEQIQKQIGKEDKIRISKTVSENARETFYSYLTQGFHSKGTNLSESVNEYSQTDFIFDTHFFTQQLETFSCLSFLSDGKKILPPMKLKLLPYFLQNC